MFHILTNADLPSQSSKKQRYSKALGKLLYDASFQSIMQGL